jgi:hypothetical protein
MGYVAGIEIVVAGASRVTKLRCGNRACYLKIKISL